MTIEELLQALNNQNFGPNDSTLASSARHPIKAAKKLGGYIDGLMRTGMGQTYSDDAFTYAPLDRSRLAAANEIAGYAQVGGMPFAPKTRGGTLGTAALPETEFSKAHKIAQKNAALPIEQGGLGLAPDNTAMDRAKALGFDTKAYKGMYPYDWTKDSLPEIDSINRTTLFPSFNGDEEGIRIAGFVSDNPEIASKFAFKDGALYPLLINKGKNNKINAAGELAGKIQFGKSGKNFRDTIRNNNIDSIDILNTKDEGNITAMINPNNIRSIFAAFDPMKKNSSNILASTLIGMLMAREQDKK